MGLQAIWTQLRGRHPAVQPSAFALFAAELAAPEALRAEHPGPRGDERLCEQLIDGGWLFVCDWTDTVGVAGDDLVAFFEMHGGNGEQARLRRGEIDAGAPIHTLASVLNLIATTDGLVLLQLEYGGDGWHYLLAEMPFTARWKGRALSEIYSVIDIKPAEERPPRGLEFGPRSGSAPV